MCWLVGGCVMMGFWSLELILRSLNDVIKVGLRYQTPALGFGCRPFSQPVISARAGLEGSSQDISRIASDTCMDAFLLLLWPVSDA